MKKLKLEIENELSILESYKLTAEEWFFIQLVFLAQEEEGHPDLLFNYMINGVDKTSIRDLLLSLQDKGVINKTYKVPAKGTTFKADNVEFNKVFLNKYLKNSGQLGMELYDAYPKTIIINKVCYQLTNITKKFNSFEDFAFMYGRAIKFNPEEHEKVLKTLNEAKELNLINYNICEFVISRKWNEIRELIDQGIDGTFNSYELA